MAEELKIPSNQASVPDQSTTSQPADKTGAGTAPSWSDSVPEKFRRATAEETLLEVAKAHKSLEAKIGLPPEKRADAVKDLKIGGNQPEPSSVADVLKQANLDPDVMSQKWADNGKLDDADYAALKNLGYPKAIVDQLAMGMAATQVVSRLSVEQATAKAAAAVGGEEAMNRLLGEAAAFVPAEQQDYFNKMLANPATVEAAVLALSGLRSAKVGSTNSRPLIQGQPATFAGKPSSMSEWMALQGKAKKGDQSALAVLDRMSQQDVDQLMKGL